MKIIMQLRLSYSTIQAYMPSIDNVLWSPLQIGRQMYQIIGRVENPRFFLMHFAGQIALTLAGNYVSFQLRQNLMSNFGRVDDYIFKTLGGQEATNDDWNSFQNEIINTAMPLVTFVAFNTLHNYTLSKYQIWFKRKLCDQLSERIWKNPASVALTNSPETNTIVKSLVDDIRSVSADGTNLLLSFTKGAQNFALSIGNLLSFSSYINVMGIMVPDLLAVSAVYTIFTQRISSFITTKISRLNERATKEIVKADSIMANDYNNIKPIFSAGVQDYVRAKHTENRETTYSLNDKMNIWSTIHTTWMKTHEYLNMLYKNLVLGYKVFKKTILSNQIYTAISDFSNVDEFISWTEQNQRDIKNFNLPAQRVQKFLEAEQIIANAPATIYFTENTRNAIEIRGLELRIGRNPFVPLAEQNLGPALVKIPQFSFKMGRRYVISGASGCGKSSLLAKVNRSLYDGIDGVGTISFPQNSKRMMLSQDDYFSEHSTLLEHLVMTSNIQELPESERNIALQEAKAQLNDPAKKAILLHKAKELLREAKIDNKTTGNLTDRLEEEQPNWKAILSGGQRKKLKIVWAILQQPTILLLDEVLVGLDKESVKTIESMLAKHLPNSLIISVDHHPDINNNKVVAGGRSESFYQEHYKIHNMRLSKVQQQAGRTR